MKHEASAMEIRRLLEDVVALAILVEFHQSGRALCRKLREAF